MRKGPSGTKDNYGNEVRAESVVETVCELQGAAQRTGNEPKNQNDLSITKWSLYLPAGTEIDSADTVIVGGESYEVDGDAWAVRDPLTQSASHVEVAVVKVSGAFDGGQS